MNEIKIVEMYIISAEHVDEESIQDSDFNEEGGLRDQLTILSNEITDFRIQIQKNLEFVMVSED